MCTRSCMARPSYCSDTSRSPLPSSPSCSPYPRACSPPDPTLDKLFRYITLEVGLLVGAALILLGLAASFYAVGTWEARHFGQLDYAHTMRLVIPAVLCLILGVQTVFASFFLSVLGLRRR
jgi:hypothetical protein